MTGTSRTVLAGGGVRISAAGASWATALLSGVTSPGPITSGARISAAEASWTTALSSGVTSPGAITSGASAESGADCDNSLAGERTEIAPLNSTSAATAIPLVAHNFIRTQPPHCLL